MLTSVQNAFEVYNSTSWGNLYIRVANKEKIVEYEDPLFQERFGKRVGQHCYKFWMRKEACEGCVSEKSLITKKPESKEELAEDGRVYLMTSIPVCLNGQWSTVEVIKDVTEAKVWLNILTIIASSLDIRQVYNLLSLELNKIIEFDRMSISVLDEVREGTVETFVLTKGYQDTELKEGTHFALKGSILERLISKKAPIIVNDTLNPVVETDRTLLREGIRSRLSYPLEYKGQIIGSLNFGSKRPENFNEFHLILLSHIVPQLAIAVENTRLFRKIKDSEERHRTLVESLPHLFFTRKKEGAFVLLSPSVRLITGYGPEEFYIRSALMESLMHPEDKEKVKAELGEVWNGTKSSSKNLEYRIYHKKGHTVWLSQDSYPVKDEHGNIYCLEGLCREISEVKKIEEIKDNLMRNVTHELKTPLAKMEMGLQLYERVLTEGKEAEKKRLIYNTLLGNLYRLKHAVQNIVDLASLESGHLKLKKEKVALKELLISAIKEAERAASKKGLKLVFSLPEEIPPLLGDSEKLYHVVMNLLDNSVKYTEKGIICITARVLPEQVEVTVTDTGRGMEKELLSKLFESFVQESPAFVGPGIGLSLCKKILEDHEGKIWAESEGKNRGASFHFTLPLISEKEKIHG
ncbi:MAG TPA: ATP-binding protein [Candidatus Hypogeohydataceae bacterium YC41]